MAGGLSFKLTPDTRDAKISLEDIYAKLKALTDSEHEIPVGLDNKQFEYERKKLDLSIDLLNKKRIDPHVSDEALRKLDLAIDRASLKTDDLKHKLESLGDSHKIKDLFSGLGSLTGKGGWSQILSMFGKNGSSEGAEGAEGASEGASGLGDFLMSPIGMGLIGTAVSVVPGAVGLGVGGGAGIGGLLAALTLNKRDKAAGSGLLASLEKDLSSSITTQGATGTADRAGNRVGGSMPTASFAQGLIPIFQQISGFTKTLGPELAGMFRASLPFLSQFASLFEQSAKVLLPAFTSSMHEMVSSGALKEMTSGLVILVNGVARFITAIGPALKPSADVFRDVMIVLSAGIDGLGHIVAEIAQGIDIDFKTVEMVFKVVADLLTGNITGVENAFDSWRHDTAAILVSMGADFGSWQHDISHIFDELRHDVAATWDRLWSDLQSAMHAGIDKDLNLLKTLFLDGTVNDLKWLGGQLEKLGKEAFDDLWSGMKSVGDDLLEWGKHLLGNFVTGIKHFLGISSPSSVFHDIGKNIMLGLSNGIESKIGAVNGSFGRVSGNVNRWASTVQEALKMEDLPLSLTKQVLYQMQTESSGNPMAINLTDINAQQGDPSRGLMQVIGTTFDAYHWPGTSMDIYNPLANIAAAINYAKHRYGPSLMMNGMGLGSGHGYANGGWITEPIAGVGLTSGQRYTLGENGPEYVSPAGRMSARGGGDTYIINVPDSATNPDAYGLAIVQAVRSFKKHHGNQPTGIG